MELSTGGLAEVSIAPGVSILGVLSNLNYEPWYALAEYVDNSIQSAAKSLLLLRKVESNYQLRVDIQYDGAGAGRLVIEDNAAGIARKDFDRAFKAAEVPPDRSGLSEFGMGMKSASIWFANNWRVVTTSVGDANVYTVEFDMGKVLSDKVDHLKVEVAPIGLDTHFTRIELWNLNQKLPGRTLGKVREHLREIYRFFLRNGTLSLSVAGQQMHYEEPEVLIAQDYRAGLVEGVPTDEQTWRKPISFKLNDAVEVDGWVAIRAEGRTNGTGLSLFRRGRVILGSGETPYKPTRIYGAGNSYRSQRLFGELEIRGLPVSHTKDGFQWQGYEEAFEEELRRLIDAEPLPLLKQAEHYRARKANRAELKRIKEATENTAAVAEKRIPETLTSIAYSGDGLRPSTLTNQVDLSPQENVVDEDDSGPSFTKDFAFDFRDGRWTVTMTASERPGDPHWLVRHVDYLSGSRDVAVDLALNTSHPFISQFALGSTDSMEAVLRVAVALTVAESLAMAAGDGESAGTFLRQVDEILTKALSKRLKDEV